MLLPSSRPFAFFQEKAAGTLRALQEQPSLLERLPSDMKLLFRNLIPHRQHTNNRDAYEAPRTSVDGRRPSATLGPAEETPSRRISFSTPPRRTSFLPPRPPSNPIISPFANHPAFETGGGESTPASVQAGNPPAFGGAISAAAAAAGARHAVAAAVAFAEALPGAGTAADAAAGKLPGLRSPGSGSEEAGAGELPTLGSRAGSGPPTPSPPQDRGEDGGDGGPAQTSSRALDIQRRRSGGTLERLHSMVPKESLGQAMVGLAIPKDEAEPTAEAEPVLLYFGIIDFLQVMIGLVVMIAKARK